MHSLQKERQKRQDVGYDGLSSDQEAMRFGNTFVNPVTNIVDPAVDDFVFYMSDKFTGIRQLHWLSVTNTSETRKETQKPIL
jgi:hypothetical protein